MTHALVYSCSIAGPRRSGGDTAPLTRTSACGVGSPAWPGHALTSGMALHIFPDCCLRQGIEAEPVAPAVEPYGRKFLLAKHGDDPIQRNTARAPDKFGVHESIWLDLSLRKTCIGNRADWSVVRRCYIRTLSNTRT